MTDYRLACTSKLLITNLRNRSSIIGYRSFNSRGLTLVELAATVAIILILTAIALPLTRVALQRSREIELRRALRTIRTAIDQFHEAALGGLINPREIGDVGRMNYPEDFDQLVEGVDSTVGVSNKLKFLRRVPIDPMMRTDEWGKRSYQDDFDSSLWGRENLYDVFTESDGVALDETEYKDW
jgi:general secretion pathway protein G